MTPSFKLIKMNKNLDLKEYNISIKIDEKEHEIEAPFAVSIEDQHTVFTTTLNDKPFILKIEKVKTT